MTRYVAYYRVSTARQGRSGLGLEAQQFEVKHYLDRVGGTLVREFTEVETGKRSDRPVLIEALRYAELTGVTLIVAKLDRLSRNAAFLNTLVDSGQKIVFADMPEASRMIIGVMAQIAQWEVQQISKRTKEALAAVKARGTKLGGDRGNLKHDGEKGRRKAAERRSVMADDRAAKVMHYVSEARSSGHTSLRQIASYLTDAGIQTPRGATWHPASIAKLLAKHDRPDG